MVKTKPTRRLQPGDLICGKCGEGNPPTRNFCSRCGEALSAATVVRRPWYRRLLAPLRRGPRTMEAGSRPGQGGAERLPVKKRVMSGYRKVRRVLAACMVVVAMTYLFVPPLRNVINQHVAHPVAGVKSKVMERWRSFTSPYSDVSVVETKTTATLAGTEGGDGVDGNTVSFWAVPWQGGRRPFLRVAFADPETINAIVVHAGASGEDASKYLQPKVLRLRYPNGLHEDVELKFSGDPQTFDLDKAQLVGSITVIVRSVYPKKGLTGVAVSDIEFKARK